MLESELVRIYRIRHSLCCIQNLSIGSVKSFRLSYVDLRWYVMLAKSSDAVSETLLIETHLLVCINPIFWIHTLKKALCEIDECIPFLSTAVLEPEVICIHYNKHFVSRGHQCGEWHVEGFCCGSWYIIGDRKKYLITATSCPLQATIQFIQWEHHISEISNVTLIIILALFILFRAVINSLCLICDAAFNLYKCL